jgi:hypothetical protein
LRKLFVKLKDLCDDKSRTITELEALVVLQKQSLRGLETKEERDKKCHPLLLGENWLEQLGGQ